MRKRRTKPAVALAKLMRATKPVRLDRYWKVKE